MPNARDGCVVETAPLAALIDTFVQDWNRDRPPDEGGKFMNGGGHREASPWVGALAWLAQETTISLNTIDGVARARWQFTELRIADPIVTAIGRPEVFYDGDPPTLPVRGNPLATLRLARVPVSRAGRLSYSARIELAGARVGRVQRFRGGATYRAFIGDALVAEAPRMANVRRELSSRARDVCCGGSEPAFPPGTVASRY